MPTTAEVELISKTADLLVKYGFLGVGLVLLFLAAPAIDKLFNSRQIALLVASFGLAFLVAFGALDIVQKYFPSWISSKRVLISGAVLKVPQGYQVQIASDLRTAGAAYLKRENDPLNNGSANFPFILVASQSPGCLSLAINNNNPQSETGSSGFKIAPISEHDLRDDTVLLASAQPAERAFSLRIWREVNGKMAGEPKVLMPLGPETPGCEAGQDTAYFDWLLPTAFAQTPRTGSAAELSTRLKSDDLFTRRDARIDLAKQGQNTIAMSREFLNTDDYRLQLGALVALSLMPQGDIQNLPPDVMAKVRQFKNSSDPTVRETAAKIDSVR